MESRIKQKLKESQHSLELYSDNVRILQKNLQDLMSEQVKLHSSLQQEQEKLRAPLKKERQNFESASREFERAQATFNRQQQAFKKAEDAYEQKAAQLERSMASTLLTLENKIRQIEKEIIAADIKAKNAERDVKAYMQQAEAEEKATKNTSNPQNKNMGGRRNSLL